MTTETNIEADTLEKTGWLILDAADYKREVDGGDTAPAAQRMRKEARKRIINGLHKLRKAGDPLDVAETITEMVKGFGKS